MRRVVLGMAAALAFGLAGGAAEAGGSLPFYGYSPYLGGPTTYFTPDSDVEQVTARREADPGFGTRTYYRGGPFWRYRSNAVRRASYSAHRPHRRAVLRRKG